MAGLNKYKCIEIVKADRPTKVFPDNNPYHEADVDGFHIRFVYTPCSGGGTYTEVINCTLDDLKELRKVVRKAIRNESNK